MTISELFNALVDGKKVKLVSDDQTKFIHYHNGKVKNQNDEEVSLENLKPDEYELVKERHFVFQWCFYNEESGDWVINPALMTEEKAHVEFEKIGLSSDKYFKTNVKFNVFL
jgi:hypothetical protein